MASFLRGCVYGVIVMVTLEWLVKFGIDQLVVGAVIGSVTGCYVTTRMTTNVRIANARAAGAGYYAKK